MSPGRFSQVAELFDALRELPEEARAGALEGSDADEEVRRAALSLLRHDSPTGAFLGRPPLAAAAELLAPITQLRTPERIGGYRIVRRLGQGGFATVYLAEQASPRRLVALKLIRRGAGKDELRRFIFEAEALARLDHPGIARVYECGVADGESRGGADGGDGGDAAESAAWGEGGAAYIVMEYVDGLPLDEHLRAATPTRAERLALLVALTDAIEHAHIRGVVHRDLAPKNILVGRGGAVKVIDFGLARELRDRDGVSLAMTMPGSVLGTLRYMSPEQLGGSRAPVDTRADLYALGVIAYETLVGGHPYLAGDEPLGAAVRLLQEGRVRRATEIDPRAGRELEAVLLKAVERRQDGRYQTAGAFAADLRNLAADRPVSARRTSVALRTVKFCRRNRWRVAAAAAVSLACVASLGSAIHANGRREESRLAAANALETLVGRLLSPLAPRIGTLAEREELLLAVAADIDQILVRAPQDPRTLRIFAGYAVLLGDVHRERDRMVEAREAYGRAVDALAGLAEVGDPTIDDMHRRSIAIVKLGDAEFSLGDWVRCRALYQEALGLDEANAQLAPDDVGVQSNLFWSYMRLAGIEDEPLGERATELRLRGAAVAQRMTETAPEDWRSWEALAQAAIAESVALSMGLEGAASLQTLLTAVEAGARLVALDPRVTRHHTTLIHACTLAISQSLYAGNVELAEELLARAEVSAAAIAPSSAADPHVEYAYTNPLHACRASIAEARGDLAAALAHMVPYLEVLDRRIATVRTDEDALSSWIASHRMRILWLQSLGHGVEAAEATRTLLDRARDIEEEAPRIRQRLHRAFRQLDELGERFLQGDSPG